jgi:hypothetical protein
VQIGDAQWSVVTGVQECESRDQENRVATGRDWPLRGTGSHPRGDSQQEGSTGAETALSVGACKSFIFEALNCAALPSKLVESELFGYERGPFTCAFEKKAGIFELADGGTILLDEIGDMDIPLQAKLLQVLQDQEFRRIGGKETVKVNV